MSFYAYMIIHVINVKIVVQLWFNNVIIFYVDDLFYFIFILNFLSVHRHTAIAVCASSRFFILSSFSYGIYNIHILMWLTSATSKTNQKQNCWPPAIVSKQYLSSIFFFRMAFGFWFNWKTLFYKMNNNNFRIEENWGRLADVGFFYFFLFYIFIMLVHASTHWFFFWFFCLYLNVKIVMYLFWNISVCFYCWCLLWLPFRAECFWLK